jgi:broad specificity phosphatase PhoE
MTTFLLIRHAAHGLLGKTLVGRTAGVHLSAEGQEQATRLAEWLSNQPIRAVYSSPLERACETAAPIADTLRLPLRISNALLELDFGEWTGRSFDQLSGDERWDHWNAFRSGTRAPGGETMLEAQARMVAELERLRGEHPDERVVVVGHSDPIKATLAYYLAMPLDLFGRLEISPASVSVLELHDWGPRILCVNHMPDVCPRDHP